MTRKKVTTITGLTKTSVEGECKYAEKGGIVSIVEVLVKKYKP